ncbi:MAG: 3-deoxy-7-phosphoheptulonate synthase [Candidatus Eremiobacteraeota bacterium]|nr:3-deoxy-7-phosphoheptulonate synthase [Candidatus Eremiobacteraeota bacterium]
MKAPYRLASRDSNKTTVVQVGDVCIGDGSFVTIAGPCAIENRNQIERTAAFVAGHGAQILRGGAYKPRTSPYDFQGLGDIGVVLITAAGENSGLPTVVEALSEENLPMLSKHIDMIQIGARNMQNFALLRAAARTGKPILLKRAASATLDELLYAAEYILVDGNSQVVLCERGVRGFDAHTRNLFDLAGAIRLKELTHLPVIADPSHATGRASLVEPLVLASAAAGLDGSMVEVHPEPTSALSDGPQSLDFASFERLTARLAMLSSTGEPKFAGLGCR